MNSVELESMIVRLLGDGSGYIQMLNQASKETVHAADQVQKQASRIEAFSASLKGYASSALSALGAIGAAGILHQAFAAFEGREVGMVKLSAALKANGRDVEALTKQYGDFAKHQAEVSLTTAGEVKDMLRRAEAFGLTGAAAEKAVSDAINIGAAADVSAEGIMRITVALAQGDTQRAMMFSRMIPQLRGVKDETEFLEKAQRLVNQGTEQNIQLTKTAEGTIHHLSLAYKGLLGDLGAVVAEGVKPYVQGLEQIVKWIRELSPATKQMLVVTLGVVAAVLMLPPALAAVSFWLSIATGGTLPLLGLIAAAVVGIVALVTHMGGVGSMFSGLKERAEAAWAWLAPVRKEIMVLWNLLLDAGTVAWQGVVAAAEWAWDKITGGTTVNWEKVKLTILGTLIAVEYGIRNFAMLWAVAVKLAIDSWHTLTEIIGWYVNVYSPAVTSNFVGFWVQAFQHVALIAGQVFSRLVVLGENMLKLLFDPNRFHKRDALNAIAATLKDLNPDQIMEQVIAFKPKFGQLPQAVRADLIGNLLKEFNDAAGALGGDFNAFFAKRMKELGLDSDVVKDAEKAGTEVGKSVNKGIAGEVGKLDAVLRGSAESLARIAAYRDMLAGDVQGKGHGGKGHAADMKNFVPDVNVNVGGDIARNDPNTQLLRDIRDGINRGNAIPDVVVNPANLT